MRFAKLALIVLAAVPFRAAAAESDVPVSFQKDLRPLLNANCNACHKPEKSKADLDMTTYAALMKGRKGGAVVTPGEPAKSKLLTLCLGDEPEMPPEGDPLGEVQTALIERWIKQGAKDDTMAPGTAKVPTPVYTVPPVVTAMAFSPDGSVLAVSGYHEVLLHKADGTGLVARLVGESPRVESIAFSRDGSMIGVAGGSPAEFGQVQIWDARAHKPLKVFQPSPDSLYGLSFAPDGQTVAVGGADKAARRIRIEDGAVVTDFRGHADWVLATTFTLDGKQMVTAGRDKAMKLVDVETGRFVDDINNPVEQLLCLARHPTEERVLYGGDLGNARPPASTAGSACSTPRPATRFASSSPSRWPANERPAPALGVRAFRRLRRQPPCRRDRGGVHGVVAAPLSRRPGPRRTGRSPPARGPTSARPRAGLERHRRRRG